MKKMTKKIISILSIFCLVVIGADAFAVKSGDPAPDFELVSSDGKTVKLSDNKGKIVVLEWLNYGCPFVKKHYSPEVKNMQNLQSKYTGQGVVWYSIISSAKGKQGHSTAAEANKDRKEHGSAATAVLLDEKGTVGRLYGAKTTPHMYIVDGTGKLVYQGAIDDRPTSEPADIKGARNYVSEALDHLMDKKQAGKPLAVSASNPYGCGVKY